jgi:tRNA dimethylallyltransferase
MILILGVTASGKNRLAFDLAESLGAEIISVDSMKVYRRMNIGTAKPPEDARRRVRYHLIDILEPSDSFSVAAFLDAALAAVAQVRARNKPVIAVGGTALYIKAMLYGLFEGPGADHEIRAQLRARVEAEGLPELYRQLAELDPKAAERIDPNDAKRIIRALEVFQLTGKPISSLQNQFTSDKPLHDWSIIGLRRDKSDANSRINARVKKMIAAGLADEVESLLAEAKPLSEQARCAIGYAEMIEYLAGGVSLTDATELIKKNTRRLAKSQRTWFKTFQGVNWVDVAPDQRPEEILMQTRSRLNGMI